MEPGEKHSLRCKNSSERLRVAEMSARHREVRDDSILDMDRHVHSPVVTPFHTQCGRMS